DRQGCALRDHHERRQVFVGDGAVRLRPATRGRQDQMISYSTEEVLDWLGNMSKGALDLCADNTGLAAAALQIIEPAPAPPPQPGYLSPHFTLAELTYSDTANARGIDNTPDGDATEQLTDLCNETLEKIRALCGGNPVIVSSGYRCPQLNSAVGGASNSAH